MLYATIFHFLAGAVTGSAFKVKTLLILLSFVLAESAFLAIVYGGVAGLWGLANLVGIQAGYLAGIYARAVCEHAGYSFSNTQTRRLR